jgi:hypothetical protein
MPDLYSGGDGECGWHIITDDDKKPVFISINNSGSDSDLRAEIRGLSPLSVTDELEPPEKITVEVADIISRYDLAYDQRGSEEEQLKRSMFRQDRFMEKHGLERDFEAEKKMIESGIKPELIPTFRIWKPKDEASE